MNKREVIELALSGQDVPYTPWSFSFTCDTYTKLRQHFGRADDDGLEDIFDNHLYCYQAGGPQIHLGNEVYQDVFGVRWDKSVETSSGNVTGQVLPEPTLDGYELPRPDDPVFTGGLAEGLAKHQDCYRMYAIGFSLYERAWCLRGMQDLMMDFYDEPEFVHELLTRIADHQIEKVKKALAYDIDAVYFGDDWGQQQGLQMGPALWKEFIYPQLKRMYGTVKEAGKKVFIHSCGDVDELFDDLIDIGLDCFNPFQPEVMDVHTLHAQYRGRLTFHGGLSTQDLLPYRSEEEVRAESKKLLEMGRKGNYIFAPAHAVEDDVPIENILAFIEEAKSQPGYGK